MKKLLCCLITLALLFALAGCQSKSEMEFHVTGFDGERLFVDSGGNALVYERYQPGVGSLTQKTRLDLFIMDTAIEGVAWAVYSTEEYPDLSYILLISGTNVSWTFRLLASKP